MPDPSPSVETLLTHADTLLAAGLQYGLWVERAPSVEEQIALSSMSQDKLGHARAFYLLVEEAGGPSTVELQYERSVAEFRWALPWTLPLASWEHVAVAQSLLARALLSDLGASASGTGPAGLLDKVRQEEGWHLRHAQGWLAHAAAGEGDARKRLEAALAELWPVAPLSLGVDGEERFAADLASGGRTQDDATLRAAYLDQVGQALTAAGLEALPAGPCTRDALDLVAARSEEHRLELVAMLQDPIAREMSRL